MREEIIYDMPVSGKQKNKKKGWLIWLAIVVGLVLLAVLLTAVGCEADTAVHVSGPYVGIVSVEGTIASDNSNSWGIPYGYQHSWTLSAIDDMIDDDNNYGLLLYVDSPGGGVYESDELYLKIKEYQEYTGRPVYAYMASVAASGGYYISAPADKIIANRNCLTGSIGVSMGTYFDLSGFLEKYGIRWHTITSGKNKAMGSVVDPMTEEQQQILYSLVNEAYEQFVGIVAEERGMELDRAKALGDGRVYTAKQALESGLIDMVSTYDDAIYDMCEEYDLFDCDFVTLEYRDNSFLGRFMAKLDLNPADRSSGDVDALLKLVEEESRFPISYLCPALQ